MRFLDACRRKPVDATPVWFMRQAGRYLPEYRAIRTKATFLEMCERPDIATEVTMQPVRLMGVDAAILYADILLPVRPMGVKLEFVKGEGPVLTPPVRSAKDVARLRVFDAEDGLGYVMETVRRVRRELAGKVPLIGFAGAPFTVASYLVEGGPSKEYRYTKAMMRGAPVLWNALMTKIAKVTVGYLQGQVKAGAQALQLFDSWVGVLSKEDYERSVKPHSVRVLAAMKKTGVPVITFGTGTSPFLESFADTPADVVGVDWHEPLDAAWKRVGLGRAVQGNMDPAYLFLPLPRLKEVVKAVLDRAAGRRGHIFNLGHGIMQHTPPENVRAVADWVHEWTAR
ncbi:MAG: uroporphyrinogen decarboxylase [Elusimicrobia bacterium]|nr:uroporphyrinogen decarboxylase [Elusimicrobiota bacterium]